MPFHLDLVVDLTCYLQEGYLHTKLDDKTGYDHLLMDDDESFGYGFTVERLLVFNHGLQFGWKISPYTFQSLGMVATQEIRNQGVPCSKYIDDCHLCQLRPQSDDQPGPLRTGDFQLGRAANCVAICILSSLGYFLNLAKSVFVTAQKLIYLGLCCDTVPPFLSHMTRS